MTNDVELAFAASSDAGASKFIEEQVVSHTIALTRSADWYPITYVLKSQRGEYLGGCVGTIWAGWLHVRWLWVANALRGQAYGTRLMDAAEAHAVEHGCRYSTLETHNPDALRFYQRRGYETVGEMPDYPAGFSKYFLRKRLE